LFFLNSRMLVQFNIALINVFSAAEEKRIDMSLFQQLLGVAKGDLQEVTQNMNLYMRTSLITSFQFQTENMLVSILAKVDPIRRTPRGFAKIIQSLLDKITVSDKDSKLKILMVLQHGRNSLHSNATHNNDGFSFSFDGFTYEFLRGKPVTCMSWFSIPPIMKAATNTIEAIVVCPEVKKIPEPIPIQFVET